MHAAIPRTIALLRKNQGQDLTTLAHDTGISPGQLSRFFKRQVGMSITDYRNRLRLDTFMERWEAEPGGVMFELAKESGFGSYAQFSRVFRRHMECCPETYYRTRRHRQFSRTDPQRVAALSASTIL